MTYPDGQLVSWGQIFWKAHRELLLPTELQGVRALPRQELQGCDAHPHQVVSVHLLKALRNHGPHTLQDMRQEAE